MLKTGKFKVIKVTRLEDLAGGYEVEIPESDLSVQTEKELIQFEFLEEEKDREKYKVKPGCFCIVNTSLGIALDKLELKNYNLLKTIDNTSQIIEEGNNFFNRLHVYKELKREPKRALLLCSPPGVGKSSAINEVAKTFLKMPGTCVIIWDTSSIDASDVNNFFQLDSNFKDVEKLILIIEDIEGSSSDGHEGSTRRSSSSLLNLLDGVGTSFSSVPTFIIGTTNNPERSVGALIDRPGRFDRVIEMKTPSAKECAELLGFILEKDVLSEEEAASATLAASNEFSIAHLQEIVVRSKIDNITVKQATEQLVEHKKRFKESFSKKPSRKLGLS